MKEKIVEPTEILTGRDERSRSQAVRANPWLRFLGRFVDYAIFFTVLRFLVPVVPPFDRWFPLEFLAWAPIEAILLATWGTTPGKWLLGTTVRLGHARKLPWKVAFRRSFDVWLRGYGLGIPFVNMFCMLYAYNRLRLVHTTSWDQKEGLVVEHHPVAPWRFYLAAVVVFAGMISYYFWKNG